MLKLKKHLKAFIIITAVSFGITPFGEEIFAFVLDNDDFHMYCLGCVSVQEIMFAIFYILPVIVFDLSGVAMSLTRMSGTKVKIIASGIGIAFAAYWYSIPYITGIHGLG